MACSNKAQWQGQPRLKGKCQGCLYVTMWLWSFSSLLQKVLFRTTCLGRRGARCMGLIFVGHSCFFKLISSSLEGEGVVTDVFYPSAVIAPCVVFCGEGRIAVMPGAIGELGWRAWSLSSDLFFSCLGLGCMLRGGRVASALSASPVLHLQNPASQRFQQEQQHLHCLKRKVFK